MAEKDIIGIAEDLRKDPSERNWKRFGSALKKSEVVYYKIFFGRGKLNKTQDLRKSYAELYDKRRKAITQIPVFMREGKKIDGATIFLVGLLILNG